MRLADVASAVSGRLDAATGEELVTHAVSDSRDATDGGLFVAIAGEREDGHAHAADAVARGCSAVLAARPVGVPAVVVDDPVAALGRLAAHVLGALRRDGLRVVAVTGSSGKTTTKDLLAAVIGSAHRTVAPTGSLNTEVGVPVTILRADESTEVLVLEMSARGLGHIAYLCGLAAPDVGVVLNVGTAHVGEFGGREAVAQAKGELVEGLAPGGVAVLNADDAVVDAMRSRLPAGCTVRTFGLDARAADLVVRDVLVRGSSTTFVATVGETSVEVVIPVPGRHIAADAAAALLAASTLGIDLVTAAAALAEPAPRSRWRMEVRETADGVTVVNDAYNANPESMRAALRATCELAGGRRIWAVLGGMGELGAVAAEEHRRLGADVAAAGVQRVIVVGALGREISVGAPAARWVPAVDDALAILRAELAPGDVVLVKASRSERLERVALALTPDPAEPAAGGVPA